MTLWKCKQSVSDVFTMSYSGREIRGCFENKNTASLKPTKIWRLCRSLEDAR